MMMMMMMMMIIIIVIIVINNNNNNNNNNFNERSLCFQLIETTCCLIGFHGNHSNIMTSLAAAILDFQIFNFFSNSNLNTENSEKTTFSD